MGTGLNILVGFNNEGLDVPFITEVLKEALEEEGHKVDVVMAVIVLGVVAADRAEDCGFDAAMGMGQVGQDVYVVTTGLWSLRIWGLENSGFYLKRLI